MNRNESGSATRSRESLYYSFAERADAGRDFEKSLLAAKFGPTLYMGRYLFMEAIGIYGLTVGSVGLFQHLLGQDFSYVVAHEIVGSSHAAVARKIRDQIVPCGINYLTLILVALFAIVSGHSGGLAAAHLWVMVSLTILDGYGYSTYLLMCSINQQIWANIILFIRGGAWVLPVVLIGVLSRPSGPWILSLLVGLLAQR